ncbi:penicillin-binding protein 1A [Sphingobium wenxiniae]|uniref:Penicillin-binding protein 1A n=1 Tax=Sphingobium wenxiniae (strain DSM 21828 / CGMCC 1.7748 / JZ-1) TaxID=595605 RepID=A0A562K8W0_SPHWJ|nr:PBP1A family penicillin-binding protein [Sphingobium wenxiniae]MBB6192457.1 penicillin-binding protein 1A [Sphingobium wenxiniae]TWH91827.1 penicillin-binding protein 1A [Sphingobium wenxiniae]
MARSGKSKEPPGTARLWLMRGLKAGLIALVAAVVAIVVAVVIAMQSLPDYSSLKSSPNGQMIRVHAADGSVIVSLGPSFGRWLPYDQIPQVMVDAMVSTEDKRYYLHPGVDPIGMARAAWVALENRGKGRRLQGASTITQQVTRNIFLNNSYSWGRKVREMVLALALERKFSKRQILELYLNKVYFGGGAYGIDAASRKFFGHPADSLNLPEAAIIAGLVKAPSSYSPTADAEAAIGRAGVVLDLMQENGAISAAEHASANLADVKMAPEPPQNSVRYFTDWALPQLDTLITEPNEPLEVYTTIDLSMQRAATAAIQANVPKGSQGALVALDRDGAVRAMVGGLDYVTSNYNRATTATRQPGSAWKLFVYMAALEAGYTPDTGVTDEPVTINGWSPRNSNGRFSGDIDVRTAFAYSVNTVAAKLGVEVGFPTIADMARRFGISTPINTHPSMVLGTSDVRLIDMTRAFASVARKGIAVAPYGITKVTTADGRLLYEHQDDTSRVLVAPWVAAGLTDLMQTAVSTGTGRAAQIGRPVAGKTGTTSSNKDGWFLGFSSGITTGVWMGRDDARAVGGLQGGRAPARAFADFMKVAVAKRPVEQFDTQVTLPEWQLEPDDEAYYGAPDDGTGGGMMVDENGLPLERTQPDAPQSDNPDEDVPPDPADRPAPQRLDQQWIDQVLGRDRQRPTQQRPDP